MDFLEIAENIKDNAKMENNIEINFEQFSIIAKTKNFIIKFFNLIMPFKNDIKDIKNPSSSVNDVYNKKQGIPYLHKSDKLSLCLITWKKHNMK